MKYTKPTAEKLTFTFQDQILAASSNGCYQAIATIHQFPQTGRGDYRLQINGKHNADHTKDAQTMIITFNQPVTYKFCNGNGAHLISGDGSSTLTIGLGYHQNPTDNIGIGDFCVESDPGLSVISVSITD